MQHHTRSNVFSSHRNNEDDFTRLSAAEKSVRTVVGLVAIGVLVCFAITLIFHLSSMHHIQRSVHSIRKNVGSVARFYPPYCCRPANASEEAVACVGAWRPGIIACGRRGNNQSALNQTTARPAAEEEGRAVGGAGEFQVGESGEDATNLLQRRGN